MSWYGVILQHFKSFHGFEAQRISNGCGPLGFWTSFYSPFTFSASFVSSKSRFCLRTGTGRALCHTSAHMLPGIRMRKLRCPSSRHYERERRRRKLELDFRSQSVVTSRQIQHLAEGNYQTKNSNSGMQQLSVKGSSYTVFQSRHLATCSYKTVASNSINGAKQEK